jgi:hypothetical protein
MAPFQFFFLLGVLWLLLFALADGQQEYLFRCDFCTLVHNLGLKCFFFLFVNISVPVIDVQSVNLFFTNQE